MSYLKKSDYFFLTLKSPKHKIETIEKIIPNQPKTLTNEVKLNSKVKVKYMNNGKDISIQIVSTKDNKNERKGGIQKIYHKSPLAQSLLGQTIGDIVKIGNLDNFVEVLDVA